jgi:hypothetical protein
MNTVAYGTPHKVLDHQARHGQQSQCNSEQRARSDPGTLGSMTYQTAPSAWKTVLTDSVGLVLVVWSIPVAILVVGTPIVLAVALVIAGMRWILS